MSDKNIVDNFRVNCLTDLKNKQNNLQSVGEEWLARVQAQCEQKREQISMTLVRFEDEVIQFLRENFKLIVQIEERRIEEEVVGLQKLMNERISWQSEHLKKIAKVIESQEVGYSKMMGKIAEGKVQQQYQNFLEEINCLQISKCDLWFQKSQIQATISQIIELLHITYSLSPLVITEPENQSKNTMNKSQTTQKNLSRSKLNNNASKMSNRQLKNNSKLSWFKNESVVSVQLEEQEHQANDQAIQQYKQTKTVRKAKKLQQKIKQHERSPDKNVQNLVRLALERKKILRQLE